MLKNYLKIAYKVLLRRKFFTFISLFGISVTLMFLLILSALMDHAFAPAAPETKLDRTLHVSNMIMKGEKSSWHGTPGFKLHDTYMRDIPGVETMAIAGNPREVLSYVNNDRIQSHMRRVDADYWKVFDFTFLEGSPFTADDYSRGRFFAVINESTRRKFFAGDSAIGRTITANGQTFQVVGVVRDVSPIRAWASGEIYVPITTEKTDSYKNHLMGAYAAILVAQDRSAFPGIVEEFKARLTRVEFPDENYNRLIGIPLTRFEQIFQEVTNNESGESPAMMGSVIIVGLILVFMFLPAINLININLSRISERCGEIGVRKAFGASSLDLVLQFVVENLFLCVVGGMIGLVGAGVLLQLTNMSGIIPYSELGLNYRIFFYSLLLAMVFGIYSGAWPAWKMSRLEPVDALKGGA